MKPESPQPVSPVPPAVVVPGAGFWTRRVRAPLMGLLLQGVSPRKISATVATGAVCSLFPFLGFTTLLNAGVGFRLRMNQPLLQVVNYVLTPIHLLMIPLFVRMGEALYNAEPIPFSVSELTDTFHHASFAEFLERFGLAGVHAFTAWVLCAPLIYAITYLPARLIVNRLRRYLPADEEPDPRAD